MNKTLAWAALFGLLVGAAAAYYRHDSWIDRFVVRKSLPSGTLGEGSTTAVEKPLSDRTASMCEVAVLLLKNQRVSEACAVLEDVQRKEHDRACEKVFEVFYDYWSETKPYKDDDVDGIERFTQRMRQAEKFVKESKI